MYSHVFVAGTFDRFHNGHKVLLRAAFEMGEKVTIGITSDKFVNEYKKKLSAIPPSSFGMHRTTDGHSSNLQSANTIALCTKRRLEVEEWLKTQGYEGRASFVYIHTPYEPATTVSGVDALVVTKQNRKTGEEINEKRKVKFLLPFHLIEVDLVPAEDNAPISSTRIRQGSIDTKGNLVMPESLRSLLQKPLGKVLTGSDILASIKNHESRNIITVGDMATKTVVDFGTIPFFAIVDGKVGRIPFHDLLTENQLRKARPCEAISVKSGPGFMSQAAILAIQRVFGEKKHNGNSIHFVLNVEGEEDLLALPVIEHAKIGSIVYYGQPGKGLVQVIVTVLVKLIVQGLLQKFEA